MAKEKWVWEIHWERCEYGGLSISAGSTYHNSREEAELYKQQRERPAPGPNDEDPFYYRGSEPSLKLQR
jgi:hypothetical protein